MSNRYPDHSHYPHPSSAYTTWPTDPSLEHALASASRVLEQPPPPSLRDVLGAYKANGDGDREVLLAVLKAKTSEDNRQAAMATLYDSMLQLQRVPLRPAYPTPAYSHSPESRHYHSVSSVSRSPPHTRVPAPHTRSVSPGHRRKRARGSQSPAHYSTEHREGSDVPAELPPSPYSSSADSPRSRGSMTIGSLLSTEPSGDGGEERAQSEM
ncbi:hypothetical protein C8F01DRAFT_1110864 [Mycena amicta]|nr:hypothetical protein C8F01DRAFT_1110864 [Mycena amicta]